MLSGASMFFMDKATDSKKTSKWSFLGVLFAVLAAFLFFSGSASAGGNAIDTADYIYFRIDTEINVLNDKSVLVKWSCGGGATSGSLSIYQGSVTDGTSSDSDGLVNGIVQIASQSLENAGANGSGCDGGESITASVSLGGWVSRTWTSSITDTAGGFINRANMDYTIVVNGIVEQLGNTLTLNGTTASATYSGTVASQSYSNYSGTYKKYIAGSTDAGTVKGGADGYVNRTSSALTISATASQSVDFGASTDSDLDESSLLFGHVVTVSGYTNGSVRAGDSLSIVCSNGGAGSWYCPVPLAHTGTTAEYSYPSGGITSLTATYTDRTTGGDAQVASTITPPTPSGGGSYSESGTVPATPATPAVPATPATEETPAVPATPAIPATPATPASRGFVSLAALNLKEGDVVSAAGSDDPDVYIVNDWGYKRLFLNPAIFGFYGHLGGFNRVKNTSSTVRDTMVTSGLFRNCETNDAKVYGVEATGEDAGLLHWVNVSGDEAVAQDSEFFKKVFCINGNEFNWYSKGADYSSVGQVPAYSR